MRIFDKRRPGLTFGELEHGDVFIDINDNVLMKIDRDYNCNAVNLDNGVIFSIPAEESVVLLKNVKLIIED